MLLLLILLWSIEMYISMAARLVFSWTYEKKYMIFRMNTLVVSSCLKTIVIITKAAIS